MPSEMEARVERLERSMQEVAQWTRYGLACCALLSSAVQAGDLQRMISEKEDLKKALDALSKVGERFNGTTK